jgi:hypothetical protein
MRDCIILAPGDSHPDLPHWKVEKVYHSPNHMGLFKFQWVRRDGVRGDRMGWIGAPKHDTPYIHIDGGSNIGTRFTLDIEDKNTPMGPDDLTLRTARWYGWFPEKAWELPPDSKPMSWG